MPTTLLPGEEFESEFAGFTPGTIEFIYTHFKRVVAGLKIIIVERFGIALRVNPVLIAPR